MAQQPAEHTKGPWSVFLSSGVEKCRPGVEAHGPRETIVCFGDMEIENDDAGVFGPTDAEMMANAHLVAAAPDLLSELKALVTAVCFADPPKLFNGVSCHEARVPEAFIDAARAAIAKATAA